MLCCGIIFDGPNMTNKNIIIKITLISILLVILTACSKQTAYDGVIGFMRSSASLELKTVYLSIGKISYLESINTNYSSNSNTTNKTSKETILLIHGLASDKDSWLQFAKNIPIHYRVIIPDLPAHGESVQKFKLNYSIDNQAKWLNELTSKLGIDKVHIVGLSMGGAIAMRFNYMFPETVSTLTLIDSHGAIKNASVVDKIYEDTGTIPMIEVYDREDFDTMMYLAMENPPYVPWFMVDVIIENKIKRKIIDTKILKDAFVDIDQSNILSELKLPTLILWGDSDKVIHVDNASYLNEKIVNSKKVIIKNTGHVAVVEKPEIVARHFIEFIKQYQLNVISNIKRNRNNI